MKNLKTFSSAIAMLICFVTFGQDKKVTGVVSDDQGPLPGVNVVVKGTTRGVQTDIDGNYTIKVNQGETLVFSFLGMQEKSYFVGASNVMNIKMQKSDVVLEESYGYEPVMRRKNYDRVQVVDAKSNEKDTTEISKEETKAKYKNETLFVIDGVPTNYEVFSKLDPNSIESVTVLNSASKIISCHRSCNEVIVIKTKKGLTKKEIRKQKRLKKDSDSTSIRFKSTH